MFSPHPEVIIEQVGVDGGLQVEGGETRHCHQTWD